MVAPPHVQHARAIRISGQTEADKRATLAIRVMGVIEELPVRQGEHVNKGDLVMRLDAEDKKAAVGDGRRSSSRSARPRPMRPSGWSRAAMPRSCRPTRRAPRSPPPRRSCKTAQAELARNEIYAPFNGVIDRVPVEHGSAIMAGGEVATLINLDPLLAIGEVSERDLRYLKLGSEADIRLVNGTTVKGTLRYISRDASTATRTFRVEVAIPNEDKTLPAGMTAEITLRSRTGRRGDPAALGRDAECGRRSRHPRGRQGQQGDVPSRSI